MLTEKKKPRKTYLADGIWEEEILPILSKPSLNTKDWKRLTAISNRADRDISTLQTIKLMIQAVKKGKLKRRLAAGGASKKT